MSEASVTSAQNGWGWKVGKGLHFKMVNEVKRRDYRVALGPYWLIYNKNHTGYVRKYMNTLEKDRSTEHRTYYVLECYPLV